MGAGINAISSAALKRGSSEVKVCLGEDIKMFCGTEGCE
jgi:hypothetical protein